MEIAKGSKKTPAARSKLTLCFRRFCLALYGSHSKLYCNVGFLLIPSIQLCSEQVTWHGLPHPPNWNGQLGIISLRNSKIGCSQLTLNALLPVPPIPHQPWNTCTDLPRIRFDTFFGNRLNRICPFLSVTHMHS